MSEEIKRIIAKLPQYVQDDIATYTSFRSEYQKDQVLENKHKMLLAYHNAYTAIKHSVVSGIIRNSEMEELTEVLRRY